MISPRIEINQKYFLADASPTLPDVDAKQLDRLKRRQDRKARKKKRDEKAAKKMLKVHG